MSSTGQTNVGDDGNDDQSSSSSETTTPSLVQESSKIGPDNINTKDNSNENQQQQTGASSSSVRGFLNKSVKLFSSRDDDDKNKESIKVYFHVHFPSNIENRGEPVICFFPGQNENIIMPLKQPHKRNHLHSHTTYWAIEIPIPVTLFNEKKEIIYRYGLCVRYKDDAKVFNEELDEYRILRAKSGNLYDIVGKINLPTRCYFTTMIEDFQFLYIIVESLNSNNLKEKLEEYQLISKNFPLTTKNFTTIRYIDEVIKDNKLREKRIFCLILIGHYIIQRQFELFSGNLFLPSNFGSILLLEAIEKIQPDTLPPGHEQEITLAVSAICRHLASINSFAWLKIFALADIVDPNYNFLDALVDIDLNDEQMKKLFKYLPKQVLTYVDRIEDDLIYSKVAQWLIGLCNTMDTLITMWNDFIDHKREKEELIVYAFTNSFQRTIASDGPVDLLEDYEKVPNNLKEILAEPFRKKVLSLLNAQINWTEVYIKPISMLFFNKLLKWKKADVINSLDCISKSNHPKLLIFFTKILDHYLKYFKDNVDEIAEEDGNEEDEDEKNELFEKKELKDEDIPFICGRWYQMRLSKVNESSKAYVNEEWKIVHSILYDFSYILPIIENQNEIYKKLFIFTMDKIKNFTEVRVLSTTSHIKELHPKIIHRFGIMIKEMLNNMIKIPDVHLITKMSHVCGCSKDDLFIPDSLCEEILCHILTKLCDHVKFSDPLVLLKSAKFWITVFNAKGCTEKFLNHYLLQKVFKNIQHFIGLITNKNISIAQLQELLKYDKDLVKNLFKITSTSKIPDDSNVDDDFANELIYNKGIDLLESQCNNFELTLNQLAIFYAKFCPIEKVNNVQSFLNDIKEKARNLDQVKLKDALKPKYWHLHHQSLNSAKKCYKLANSQTFRNVFDRIMNEKANANITTEHVAKSLIPQTFNKYNELCKKYAVWEKLKCSEGSVLWENVENVEMELELMDEYVKVNHKELLVTTLKYLSGVPKQIRRLQQLSDVAIIFKVIHTKQDWLSKILLLLKGDYLWLGKLNEFYEINNKHLLGLDDKYWELIEQLSRAREFVSFLQSIAEHDIKNLINGVEEHSDGSLVQEDTVSSLIQVKQSILPLMKSSQNLTLKDFIKELSSISKANPSLSKKVELCNGHHMELKNFYNNISNKGEAARAKISNAVRKGIYTFQRINDKDEDKCSVTMTYPSKVKVSPTYTLNDLYDLRGRALLIAKPSASIDINDKEKISKDIIDKFVSQVDLAQEIINIATKLIQMGHFDYREFNVSIVGNQPWDKFVLKLKKDLGQWHEQHYYLTFFPVRHILKFYDYFMNYIDLEKRYANKQDEFELFKKANREECETLIKFVNIKATLPPPPLPNKKDTSDISHQHNDYYKMLSEIGLKLFNIFESIQRSPREIKIPVESIMSDVVQPGKLFVASCDDKFLVPNIIISLYVNHQFYPEPWQILICTPSTTMEELTMRESEANDYYLALICCKKDGLHHHILDQFSQDVHTTKGLGTESMKLIYNEICHNQVVVVSSGLSGQGKTEWIRQESFKTGKFIKSFLISDEIDFCNLVKKFRKFKLRKVDSLHLNIISSDFPLDVNIFLFQLLTLGVVSNNMDIALLPLTPVFIEVASTMGQELFNSLKFVNYLPSKFLVWSINQLITSEELTSPLQIVSLYLDYYDKSSLDRNDLILKGTKSTHLVPVTEARCQELLTKYLFKDKNTDIFSFRFIEIFVNVLADQLVRLSSSSFFKVENIRLMVNDKCGVRTTLVQTLIDVSKDFATKSIKTRSAQTKSLQNKEDELSTIVQWDDSNHLLVFFMSQLPDSICALYRDKTKVPDNVKNLLKSQCIGDDGSNNYVWSLDDYHTMSTDELLKKLECLARKTMHSIPYHPYALSADNLLKMALILLRARANIPVVVCGEAGCGKTSLIGFLAKVVEVDFLALNLHAGISEQAIFDFMDKAENIAEKGETWIFFDEINTCIHIGLLSDLIAHRMLFGVPIHDNIRLFAACNPYRLRNKNISQVGLIAKTDETYEERSKLVYQVKPLPYQILDYVWDYGILKPNDELKYIQIMVSNALKGLADNRLAQLLFESQNYIRHVEEPYSVSLRDVKRAIKLVKFFHTSLQNRPPVRKHGPNYPPNGFPDIITRSYVLALGLCYQSRIYDQKLRKQYRIKMCEIFYEFKVPLSEESFLKIIRDEQEDYIFRMTCPPNTAFNEALLENVLVMVACILCKIPVFIIGAPGSSKSLAIRLVSQNLRGSDSNDEYFRTLPQVYLIPHQGSASSTSEGIDKVFQKAKKYQDTGSEDFPVISVVLLDEVGLAEISPFNPLKVLHSLLEPSYPNDGPSVSVVGISNWRLDNSKSSRALLVQRPKFNLKDLVDTADRLLKKKTHGIISKSFLVSLAEEYLNYEKNGQKYEHFHGLRDYYSLVKSLSMAELNPENIQMALIRNFGGTDINKQLVEEHFEYVLKTFNNQKKWEYKPIPVEKLINANIQDEGARHLMVIGKSESIVNLLNYQLKMQNLDPVVILGSQFPEDHDDYSYNILSRIMMCVEAGRPLILTDLEIIYGSLYDLWNQSYVVVGSSDNPKYYARVALGAYANPLLHVEKGFRCILVMDEDKIKDADPPLLNRFEKQKMSINDIIIKIFDVNDLFIGYDPNETLQSLVIDVTKINPSYNEEQIIDICKRRLIAIASSDGIVRSEKSNADIDEKNYLKKVFFKQQCNDHLLSYFKSLLDTEKNLIQGVVEEPTKNVNPDGTLVIINTFSNINTDIKSYLQGFIKCQIEKLSTFKTEAELQKRIRNFWFESTDQMLILQCDVTSVNAGCIKLAKFIIEQYRDEYLTKQKSNRKNKAVNEIIVPTKHACIILHIHREQHEKDEIPVSFNFICGWDQITIENLTQQENSLSSLLDGSISDVIQTSYKFEEVLRQELLWCLLRIKYPSNKRSVDHIKTLNEEIIKNQEFIDLLSVHIQKWLQANLQYDWQYEVASTKKLLYPHSSFTTALQMHIRQRVRIPIAKILCALENYQVTRTFFLLASKKDESVEHKSLYDFWIKMFNNPEIISIDNSTELQSDKNIIMPNNVYVLQFPFSYYLAKQINGFKKLFEEEIKVLCEQHDNLDPTTGELYNNIMDNFILTFSKNILSSAPILRSSPLDFASDLYFKDFVTITALDNNLDPEILEFVFSAKLGSEKILNPVYLHTYLWRNIHTISTEAQLLKVCPDIIDKIKEKDIIDLRFGEFLMKNVSETMLDKLTIGELPHYHIESWVYEVDKIMLLSNNIKGASTLPLFQVLKICYDLIPSISIKDLQEIINAGKNSNKNNDIIYSSDIGSSSIIGNDNNKELLSNEFIVKTLETLKKLQPYEKNLAIYKSFIMKCLEIVPSESKVSLYLYDRILSQPFPLMEPIVRCIFANEKKQYPNLFLDIIENPRKVLSKSAKIAGINKCLAELDSPISTLCCDVIQQNFLNNLDVYMSYQKAIESLYGNNMEPLQIIVSIAFLKLFVTKLWDAIIKDNDLVKTSNTLFFDIGEFNGPEVVNTLNNSLSRDYPLIKSFKFYFLKELRQRGFYFNEIKDFCLALNQNSVHWFSDLKWDLDHVGVLPFNPYWVLDDYHIIEKTFKAVTDNNTVHFKKYLEILKNDSTLTSRIAFFGFIFTRLQLPKSAGELRHVESEVNEILQKGFELNQVEPFYKKLVKSLINNEIYILKVDQQFIGNLEMKSVIAHIIGLYSSLPSKASRLSAYLHKLDQCNDEFILSCPPYFGYTTTSETGISRYSCKCGSKYVVNEDGGTIVEGTCVECKNKIGGVDYQPKEEDKLIKKQQTAETDVSYRGYVPEVPNISITYTVRNGLSPSSYRILHFMVNVVIGAHLPSTTAINFIKRHGDIQDPIVYLLQHMENDWNVLIRMLDLSDEELALLFHAILNSISEKPYELSRGPIENPRQREDWETSFAKKYIIPFTKNAMESTTQFRFLLDESMNKGSFESKIVEEVDQTSSSMDKKYHKSHLPKLWRYISESSFDNFRAYYCGILEQPVTKSYPFLTIFFKHHKKLNMVKHLSAIIKFVKILSSRLGYRITRLTANNMSFKEYMVSETKRNIEPQELEMFKNLFRDFSASWNQVIKEAAKNDDKQLVNIPGMNMEKPIIFGLIDPKDDGSFVHGIVKYLVEIQNSFLRDVLTIPVGKCESIKFLQEPKNYNVAMEKMNTKMYYYLPEVKLDKFKENNLINYEWDDNLLMYSQRSLAAGHGQEIIYDLQKIEEELAKRLVYEKYYIEQNNENLYLESFQYHMEMFQESNKILNDIKLLIPQEIIPNDKTSLINESISNSEFINKDNTLKILSFLEIILCFIKRASIGNGEILIEDFIYQWTKLSSLADDNNEFKNILEIGLKLKNIIGLYELIEDYYANGIIESSLNFEAKITEETKSLPAKSFALALKRFMFRFLTSESVKEDESLGKYLIDMSFNLWSSDIKEELVKENFPKSLLVSHTFATYKYILKRIEVERDLNKTFISTEFSSGPSAQQRKPKKKNINRFDLA
ncbi:6354_t:CDS:10 [Entrophospora sp. SA101]|nr:6354_t:CDS:10 [Entrophospora sp. SA101]